MLVVMVLIRDWGRGHVCCVVVVLIGTGEEGMFVYGVGCHGVAVNRQVVQVEQLCRVPLRRPGASRQVRSVSSFCPTPSETTCECTHTHTHTHTCTYNIHSHTYTHMHIQRTHTTHAYTHLHMYTWITFSPC